MPMFRKKSAKRPPDLPRSLPMAGESLRDRFMERCFDLGLLVAIPFMILIFAMEAWLQRC